MLIPTSTPFPNSLPRPYHVFSTVFEICFSSALSHYLEISRIRYVLPCYFPISTIPTMFGSLPPISHVPDDHLAYPHAESPQTLRLPQTEQLCIGGFICLIVVIWGLWKKHSSLSSVVHPFFLQNTPQQSADYAGL
jgi:hypothetical protein